MCSQVKTLYLPDTLENWPWARAINPYYTEVKAEATAWFHSFKAFSAQSQYAFDKCDFVLLSALFYPKVSKEQFRSGCELMYLYFVIDEYTDFEPQHVVRDMIDTVIDALKNPNKLRPQGEVILGEIARQFWQSAIKIASPASQSHFLERFFAYLESVVEEAAYCDNNRILSIESYLKHRRENVGTRPMPGLLEFPFNLTDEVIYHPTIVKLSDYMTEMVIVDNDIFSYNREQATGRGNYNLLTVVMRELNIDLDEAVGWAVKHHAEVQTKFLNDMKNVPSWGAELDCQVQEYLDGVARIPRGNYSWSFESGRYFGDKAADVLKNRRITLLPKVVQSERNASLHRENVVVHLIEDLECVA